MAKSFNCVYEKDDFNKLCNILSTWKEPGKKLIDKMQSDYLVGKQNEETYIAVRFTGEELTNLSYMLLLSISKTLVDETLEKNGETFKDYSAQMIQ